MSIRLKIFFFILIPSMVIFILSLIYLSNQFRELTIENSKKIADLYASQAANTTETMLEQDLSTVKALKNSFLGYTQYDATTRENFYNQILKNLLLNNKEYLSVWMSWELSEISNEWNSPYGRKRTATLKENGIVTFYVDSADIEGDDIKGLYYKLKSGEYDEVIADPYLYTYSSADTSTSFFETTIAASIVDNKSFAGVVGIDVSLERFQNIITQIAPFDKSFVFIVANNGTIVAHPNRNFQGKLLTSTYINLNADILDVIKAGNTFTGFTKNQYDEEIYISFVPINVGLTNSPWAVGMIVPKRVILSAAKENFTISIILVLAVTIFVSIVMMLMYSRITNPLRKTTKILVELERGNIQKLDKIEVKTKDELGLMANSVNNLVYSLNSTAEFAKKIGTGDLLAEYKLLSNEDVLGNALLDMQKNLISAKESEEIRQAQNQRLSWAQNGITQINEILRLENDSLEQLTFSITTYLVKYLNANQGGFYVIEDENLDDIHINLISAYAYDRKKQITSKLSMGEGLVGRSIKEKETIYIKNLPDGYMYISSGLGERTPHVLLITPLIFEESIFGAIEIASFREFEEYQRDFMLETCERIASSISNIKKNVRTNELLKQSQAQAEKIQARELEFNEKLKELETLQSEVSIKSKETKELISALSRRAAIAEYTPEGMIISISNYLLSSLGENIQNLVGKNQRDLADEAKESPEWFNQFWDDLRKGRVRRRKFIVEKNSKKIYFDETYIPLKDIDGHIYKILNLGIDITENEELKERIKVLTAQKEI